MKALSINIELPILYLYFLINFLTVIQSAKDYARIYFVLSKKNKNKNTNKNKNKNKQQQQKPKTTIKKDKAIGLWISRSKNDNQSG